MTAGAAPPSPTALLLLLLLLLLAVAAAPLDLRLLPAPTRFALRGDPPPSLTSTQTL